MKDLKKLAFKPNGTGTAVLLFDVLKTQYLSPSQQHNTIPMYYVYNFLSRYAGIIEKKEKWKIVKSWCSLNLIILKKYNGIRIKDPLPPSPELGGNKIEEGRK